MEVCGGHEVDASGGENIAGVLGLMALDIGVAARAVTVAGDVDRCDSG